MGWDIFQISCLKKALVIFVQFLISSLQNIYKELISDIDGFQHPGHGDLTGWAQQGT